MKYVKYSLTCLALMVLIVSIYEVVKVKDAKSLTPEIRIKYLSDNLIKIKLENIPHKWIDMLIKIEDPAFYEHKGIDISSPGAGITTITQAMTKYMYFDNFKPGFAKLEQSLIAHFVVDRSFSKNEQLEIFYNSAYLGHYEGNEIRGFSNAAMVYYSKNLQSLSDDEYLSLVALLVAPNTFSLIKHPEKNTERVDRLKRVISGSYQPSGVTDIMYDKNV